MSGNYTEYTTRIFLNDSEAENKLKKLREEVVSLKAEKEKALSDQNMTAFNKAEKDIRKCEKEMKALATTSQSVDKVLSNLSTASVDDIERTIRALNRELRSGAVERNSKEWRFLNEQLKKAKGELSTIASESKEANGKGFFGSIVEGLNKNWGAITQIWASATGLSQTIRQTTDAFAGMDQEMANTRKYTGQTSDEVERMNNDFKKINTRTSREELNQLAGAAGRLGIQSTEKIEEFTDAADKIGVSLGDDLGNGAVDKIGKLAMAFGEDDRKGLRGAMLATGSAINELAQNSSANAGYLVEFTARLAGVGQQAGLTQSQIMGFGAVLDENMQKDEMAATALSKIITEMATDSSKMAQIAGLDVKKFANLVQNDMNKALVTFFEALNKKGGLTKLAPMFADMGLDGSRAVSVLTVMANKIKDVRDKQELATKAYNDGTSVLKEFAIQNNTIQAGIDKNKKKFHDLAIILGQQLMPIVKYTISGGSLMVKVLSTLITFVTKHRTVIITATAALTAYVAIQKGSIVIDKLKVLWTDKIVKALKLMYTTMLKNPYLAIGAAIITVIAAYKDWQDSIKEVSAAQQDLQEVNEQSQSDADNEKYNLEQLYKAATDKAQSDEVRKKAIEELNKISPEYLGLLNSENINTQKARNAIDAYTNSILLNAKAKRLASKIDEIEEKKRNAKNDDYTKWYDFFESGVNDIADKIERARNGIQTLMSNGSFSSGWNDKTSLDGYALNASQAAMIRYNNTIISIETEEKTLREELRKTNLQLLKNKAAYENTQNVFNNSGGGNGTYKSDKQRKKEEAEAKKREAAALKAKREADKAAKAQLTSHIAELTSQYSQGIITYSEYLEKKEKMELASIKIRKEIWGEGTTEAKQLSDDEIRSQEKYNNAMQKLREDDIENARVAQAAYIKAQYYDKNSSIYMNEDALNEALYENDMSALADRIAAETEGSENWLQLKAEMEQRELDHQVQQQDDYQQKLTKFREEWGKKDVNEQEKIALNGLEDLHTKGLISEKEYQEMLLQIKRHYAAEQAAADAEDKGPGSNTRKFNEDTTTVLNKAKAAAGDVSNPGSDNAMDSLFTNDFTNWKNVNEQIKIMEQTGVASHAQANAAKAQNDNEYLETLQNRTQLVYNSINTIMSAASAYSQACSDLEVARITSNYNKQIQAAGKNSKKKEKLEKERDKKIAEAKTKANKKAMGMEIAQAIAQTAMGAISAYSSTMAGAPYPSNLVLAPISAGIALAAGALQIATIQKSHQTEQMGYEEGGFTGGYRYKKQAGIVHEGEFVANHNAVNNPSILPALQLIDLAQRNNTVSSLTGDDVSRAVGNGNAALVAPIVNVQTNSQEQQEMRITIERLSETVDGLQKQLSDGIYAYATIDGEHGVKKQLDRYNRLISNK